MLRRLLIAVVLGGLLVLILPRLLEAPEINFQNYVSIQSQPKILAQSIQRQFQYALRVAAKQPANSLALLDQITLTENEFSASARGIALVIRSAGLENDSAYTYTLTGQALANIGAWNLSMIAFENAIQINPDYAEAWAYLGESQQQIGLDGRFALQKATDINPLSVAANLFNAIYWQRSGNFDEAFRYLQIAQIIDPTNIQILLEEARTRILAGNILEARIYFERALELEPKNQAIWKAYAQYSLDNDIYLDEIAMPAALRALALEANDPEALRLMAQASQRTTESHTEALRLLKAALSIDPEYFEAHMEIAKIYLSIGEFQLAKEHLENALEFSLIISQKELAQNLFDQFFFE